MAKTFSAVDVVEVNWKKVSYGCGNVSDNLTIRPASSSTEQLSMLAFLTSTTGTSNTQCCASSSPLPYFLTQKQDARTKFLDFVAEHETRGHPGLLSSCVR